MEMPATSQAQNPQNTSVFSLHKLYIIRHYFTSMLSVYEQEDFSFEQSCWNYLLYTTNCQQLRGRWWTPSL